MKWKCRFAPAARLLAYSWAMSRALRSSSSGDMSHHGMPVEVLMPRSASVIHSGRPHAAA